MPILRKRPNEISLVAGFRLKAIRVALVLAWAGLGALAYTKSTAPDGLAVVFGPLTLAALILIGLSVAPWRNVLQGQWGDRIILSWSLTVVVGITFSSDLGLGTPALVTYTTVIVFAGILLSRIPAMFVAMCSVLGWTSWVLRAADSSASAEIVIGSILLLGLGILTSLIADELEAKIRSESIQLNQLRRQEGELLEREHELERLYAVSRTIGAGSSFVEVIPELVRRVSDAVNARTGFVLAYRKEQQGLELLNPVIRGTRVVAISDHLLPLTENGVPQKVYLDDEPIVLNRREPAVGAWAGLLDDIELPNLVAVPMEVESQPIGVLLVADKITGIFTDHDISALTSLAAPAALVLHQVTQLTEAKETSEKMAELAQLKSDFVSVVSHELRTPLTSIIGVLRTLERPELAPQRPESRQLLESATKQANRLRSMIEDLLVASRIDNRAVPVRPQPIQLEHYLRETVAGIPGASEVVTVQVPAGTPSVILDPQHLNRIVVNLVVNSMKYGEGSPIEVEVTAINEKVTIAVVDHGPGFPYEMNDRAFERFTQIRRTEVKGNGGIGLGLAISRGLTEAMGGRVKYEPTIGGGATFKLSFPTRPKAFNMQDPEVKPDLVELVTISPDTPSARLSPDANSHVALVETETIPQLAEPEDGIVFADHLDVSDDPLLQAIIKTPIPQLDEDDLLPGADPFAS